MFRCGNEQAPVGVVCFNCGNQAFGKITYRGVVDHVNEKWLCPKHYNEFLEYNLKEGPVSELVHCLCGKKAFGRIHTRGLTGKEEEKWCCFQHYKELLGARLK
jgi:hypothetical protein